MLRILILAVALAPVAARAQLTITETGDEPDEIVNIAECKGENGADSTLGLQWTISTATVSSVELRISDTSGCPTDSTTAKTATLESNGSPSDTASTGTTAALGLIEIGSAQCDIATNKTIYFCAVGKTSGGQEVSGGVATATLTLDRSKPTTPDAPSVSPAEGALRVSWTAVSGTRIRYRVEVTPQGGGNVVRTDEQTGTSVRIDGLTIGTTYDVVVVAISEGGNESDPSPVTTGVPVDVTDFWDGYQGAGGGEEGGCSTGSAGALALLGLAPLALRRRRS